MPVLVTPCREPGVILTRREKTYSAQRRQIRNGTPAVAGEHCGPPAERPTCCREPGATSPCRRKKTSCLTETHRCREISSAEPKPFPPSSMIAPAIGAAAFGAIAVGALAIGRLALGRMTVKKARFQALEVDELTVGKLRVREYDGPPPPA